jgi:hypothetical protein
MLHRQLANLTKNPPALKHGSLKTYLSSILLFKIQNSGRAGLPRPKKSQTLKVPAKFAGGIALNLHKGLKSDESGCARGDGDVHDYGDDRGSARDSHR